MFCMKCGQELPDNAAFCVKCGSPVAQPANQGNTGQGNPNSPYVGQPYEGNSASGYRPHQGYQPQETNTSPPGSKRIKCPNCGGRHLQSISDMSTTVVSSGSKIAASSDSKTYWVCSDCGHKFRNLSEWKKELEVAKKLVIGNFVAAVCALFLGAILLDSLGFIGNLLIVLGVISGLVALALHFKTQNDLKNYKILERSAMD